MLHPDRLFPSEPALRDLARGLYAAMSLCPIVSPHGHTDPQWWGENPAFEDAAALFVIPDHYVTRMLVSQGVPFEAFAPERDRREVWRLFAQHYTLFAGTPSRLWIDHSLQEVFGLKTRLSPATADDYFDAIGEALAQPAFRPRALYDRFGIEVIATTDSPLDDLRHHRAVAQSDWGGRVLPTYRPDAVIDPQTPDWQKNLDLFGALTGCDTGTWQGYLEAHRLRRGFFIAHGATASDHGHPSAYTADLPQAEAAALFDRLRAGKPQAGDEELFRGQMLTECARMSIEDGLVMQLHAGSFRNHNRAVFAKYGRDRGFDIPQAAEFTRALKPLLDAFGMDNRLRLILFTLDEATYARELAPLAGAYPALRLGPPWWFHDSFEGIKRFRAMATETAGFYNTVGFNDDTRALCSIPARHDVSRRSDAAFLAELVASHRLDEEEAYALAPLLASGLAKEAYRL